MSASLLIYFISSGCSLPDSLPPFLPPSISQTDSCWLTPSVVVHSVQSLPSVPPSRSKYAFIFHFPPSAPDPVHQPGRTCSSLQFTQEVRKLKGPPCGLLENSSDISVQSEFVWSVAFIVGDVFVFELPQVKTV